MNCRSGKTSSNISRGVPSCLQACAFPSVAAAKTECPDGLNNIDCLCHSTNFIEAIVGCATAPGACPADVVAGMAGMVNTLCPNGGVVPEGLLGSTNATESATESAPAAESTAAEASASETPEATGSAAPEATGAANSTSNSTSSANSTSQANSTTSNSTKPSATNATNTSSTTSAVPKPDAGSSAGRLEVAGVAAALVAGVAAFL